jgi:hypothetical protein
MSEFSRVTLKSVMKIFLSVAQIRESGGLPGKTLIDALKYVARLAETIPAEIQLKADLQIIKSIPSLIEEIRTIPYPKKYAQVYR